MTKEELEKMFDEEFSSSREYLDIVGTEGIKSFIFETIIPEVLKSIIPKEQYADGSLIGTGINAVRRDIIEKAKENFGITL